MSDDKKLTPLLSSLLDTADTLNARSKKINTILQTVEEQLVQANVGLEVWLASPGQRLSADAPGRDDDDRLCVSYTEFGFTRLHDGWHLAAQE